MPTPRRRMCAWPTRRCASAPRRRPSRYLNIDALLEAARRTGADAVHPGYGFLSERADFAQACADAGLVFIGPPPAAITAMGDKARRQAPHDRRRRALRARLPRARTRTTRRSQREARALGSPAAGQGRRRRRRARHAARAFDSRELPAALAGARREAQSAFGDGTLMLERLIEDGRHIEIQVFADRHGHAIHLGRARLHARSGGGRRSSRRRPRPSSARPCASAWARDAVAAALAVGYVGAGTVEFIVDADLKHYFLEMNTRLQVEHPVTECITGLDLVEWQLRVAAGEPLPLAQDEVRFQGHAIEVRLYAEDPYAGFAPQTGRVLHWRPDDALRPGVRIDQASPRVARSRRSTTRWSPS